jgi:subtilisin family serine protease
MKEKIRVLVQMRHTPVLSMSATRAEAPSVPVIEKIRGFHLDQGYFSVKVPRKERRRVVGPADVGRVFSFDLRPEVSTYLIRGEVEDEAALEALRQSIAEDPDGVGVFSDPRISAIATCPRSPVGTHQDVADRLGVLTLQNRGMDGSNVLVAVVDTGINLNHLREKGQDPLFDGTRSWSPVTDSVLGDMPVDHGTMCAFDVGIAAPRCTLLDYALLQSTATGGSAMDGFLSDAVRGFSQLLDLMAGPNAPAALVVNNSWGMFHSSWDFPVGHPGNYSDNPEHPFNIIVESLEDAGADILFAAGNCGAECPDTRCEDESDQGIYGANSHPSVLSIAGVTVDAVRLGYSTQGPGRLDQNKPDLCAYTHFGGSEVYDSDGGTSAACPTAAGVVAAIRSVYSSARLPPAQLRNLMRRSARDLGGIGFDFDHGYGLIDVPALLDLLDRSDAQPIVVGQQVAGNLKETGATLTYKLAVGSALNIDLDGPSGVDFDIYVRKGAQPTTSEYDHRGYTSSADEKIRIEPMEAGDYYIMVRSYRGAGSFTLRATIG